ncbi:hypothetical protein LAZ67_X000972 [Cordylochernes scorpioides]|uniref:Uncharacterized protein n=1 Tax=Cordylochernes scorpioides TaxID=51811 RepID=A0ABY6LV84_9ARAC|nr:hypothetical protein LAZ67_X000972 [Cordylochernes scorpioides]
MEGLPGPGDTGRPRRPSHRLEEDSGKYTRIAVFQKVRPLKNCRVHQGLLLTLSKEGAMFWCLENCMVSSVGNL